MLLRPNAYWLLLGEPLQSHTPPPPLFVAGTGTSSRYFVAHGSTMNEYRPRFAKWYVSSTALTTSHLLSGDNAVLLPTFGLGAVVGAR